MRSSVLATLAAAFLAVASSAPVNYVPPAAGAPSGSVVRQSVNPIQTSFEDSNSSGAPGISSPGLEQPAPAVNNPAFSVSGSSSTSGRTIGDRNRGTETFLTSQFLSGNGIDGADGAFARDSNSAGQFFGRSDSGTRNGFFSGPRYEDHVFPKSGTRIITSTVVSEVTKTHTLRVPSTSDVWVTSVRLVTVPVTQLATERRYVPAQADVVTSYIRITQTPVSVITRTAEAFPTKTMVSVFTLFNTVTSSIEFWQPIEHRATNYEVLTMPVLQTQTLLQRVFTTVTITSTVDTTSVRPIVLSRVVPQRNYGYF